MTVTMIVSGGGLDTFAAYSYAADEQDAPAVSQDQEAPEESAADPQEESEAKAPDGNADKEASDEVKDEPVKSESSDSKAETTSEAKSEDSAENNPYELHAEIKLSEESTWKGTAVCDDKAGIPEGAKLNIEEVEQADR